MNSILIGKIVNIHGIKGHIKVYPYTDDIDNLTKLKSIFFDKELTKKKKITSCKVHKNMLIVKLEGINTVKEANDLRDINLYIPKQEIDEDDTFYIEDLIDIEVFDIDKNYLGIITYVFNTGANDVYEIEMKDKQKAYIPAIKQVVKEVDIKNKRMYVEVMEGLF